MFRTIPKQSHSTYRGMRRILKRPIEPLRYLKLAVESGVYRSEEELEKMWDARLHGGDDLRYVMKRFRQDIVRGSSVLDYPEEYFILRQYPALPRRQHIPRNLERRLRYEEQALQKEKMKKNNINQGEKLMKKYMERYAKQQQKENGTTSDGGSTTSTIFPNLKISNKEEDEPIDRSLYLKSTERHYRHLLGVEKVKSSSDYVPTADVQRAYAASLQHYHLQRTNPEDLSEEETMKKVDELLSQTLKDEVTVGRQQLEKVKKWRDQFGDESNITQIAKDRVTRQARASEDDKRVRFDKTSDSLASIFEDDTHTLIGLQRWSQRLQTVPYNAWTLGATTALDHWMARQVLKWSETTWLAVLQGYTPKNSHGELDVMARGRELIQTREQLFPETRIHLDLGEIEEAIETADVSQPKESQQSGLSDLEKLLSTISSNFNKTFSNSSNANPLSSSSAKEETLGEIMDELQEWRQKHHNELPYESWSSFEQSKFDTWLTKFITNVASTAESSSTVDRQATREALLAAPPTSKEESKKYWDAIDQDAVAFLEKLHEDGVPEGASPLQSLFWKELSFEEQLAQLQKISALRPLLDDYATEADKLKFLARHGDTLLEGVMIEHLVIDPNGPIAATDLGTAWVRKLDLPDSRVRFRIERRPYRSVDKPTGETTDAHERTKLLLEAWNEYKMGRAYYEEKMFLTGRLGLRYPDEKEKKDDKSKGTNPFK